ncbi:Pentatricopeptide repeat-containing protein [Rhynchospora pubera]|uniref:Pentatricopeptide repeat-containing protein n=1 Tax=Rhynchospora pubera TaxID=906938 RepID=A0AAV8HQ21_9POAL|nr:Pentatricopeptide repeat-containing protein [Rhynchospora pubera]
MLRHYLRNKPLPFFPNLSNPRLFSSAPAPVLAQLFSGPVNTQPDEISSKIGTLNLTFTPDSVSSLILDLKSSPDACYNFFNWVVEKERFKPNSKCYNSLLQVLGTHGRTDQFWGLVGTMRKEKGYGIDRETFLQVSESFKKNGLYEDFKTLNGVYQNTVSRVCVALRSGADEGEVFGKLDELGIDSILSTDLVISVLEKMEASPKRALFFFNWLEQKNLSFEITSTVYSTLIRVLAKERYTEEFSRILHKMKDAGIKLENDTHVTVMRRFIGNRMISAAVELFQFSPYDRDLLVLLKKVVTSKDFDVELVSKVIGSYLKEGNSIVHTSIFDGIVKSLISVGRLGECGKVLKAMERGGFKPDSVVHTKVVLGLCDVGKLDEAVQYFNEVEESGYSLDRGFILDKLVTGFCTRKQTMKAYKVLKEMVKCKAVRPMHNTYRNLIENLVRHGSLKEAFMVLPLMKVDGFPPFIDLLVEYIAKKGSVEDALSLLKAMTGQEFPSRRVYLRLFEAFFQEGRANVAQDLLSRSPGSVRNNADVLDLFYAMKAEQTQPEIVSLS